MWKRSKTIASSAIASVTLCTTALAQTDEPPNIVSIEMYGCNYQEGNDMSDFMSVVDQWNEWADERGISNYEASVLTPYYFSPAMPYDVLWLGVSSSEEDMGSVQAEWLANGREVNAEFGEVVDCDVHMLFAATATHVPQGPMVQNDGMVDLLSFQDCSLINESNAIEALAAHREWGDHMAENGSDVFMGAMFPVAGENPSADYNYKAVMNFSSAEALGEYLGTMIPAGLQRAGQIFGRVTQCDSQRIYTSLQVRASAQ
jgi:hypothetical protein